MMNLDLPIAELDRELVERINAAVDTADGIMFQSLSTAQEILGLNDHQRPMVIALAAAHMKSATAIYTAREIVSALHVLAPEIAGAISEAGTDIGASLADYVKAPGTHSL